MYLCAVYGYIVPYGHVVADFDGGFLVEGVQYRAVLYVYAVADADGVDIAAQHGVEPYAASVAHYYVADNGGVVGKETVFAEFRCEAPDGFY